MSGSPRVAVIDSGVFANHPHVAGVASGVAIAPDGREEADYTDRLGHGTAVTAAIREKAPGALIYAVKIFHDSLRTNIDSLIHALVWSASNRMDFINLSLGTDNPQHEPRLKVIVDQLAGQGIQLVAAYEDAGVRWLPGILPGVIPVALDWDCPRDQFRTSTLPDGRTLYHASGYPRPIPGVAPDRNLKGISFAVANVTGLLARAC